MNRRDLEWPCLCNFIDLFALDFSDQSFTSMLSRSDTEWGPVSVWVIPDRQSFLFLDTARDPVIIIRHTYFEDIASSDISLDNIEGRDRFDC